MNNQTKKKVNKTLIQYNKIRADRKIHTERTAKVKASIQVELDEFREKLRLKEEKLLAKTNEAKKKLDEKMMALRVIMLDLDYDTAVLMANQVDIPLFDIEPKPAVQQNLDLDIQSKNETSEGSDSNNI